LSKSYSIASAQSRLPGILHDVERGEPVEITRRGKPIAVVLSIAIDAFRRMSAPAKGFAEVYGAWRRSVAPEDLEHGAAYFDGLRDPSVGPDVKL
jgi:prevent-host-death family protein